MKYYIKDNQIISYNKEGAELYGSPIHPDGKTILPKHDALEYDEEGNITNPDVVAILDAEAKGQAKNQVNTDYEAQVNALTEGVPEAEIKTWTKQELEARAYQANNTASTPLIDALCEARGVSKDYLVGKIIDKAEMYAVAIGSLTGARQKAEDEFITQA